MTKLINADKWFDQAPIPGARNLYIHRSRGTSNGETPPEEDTAKSAKGSKVETTHTMHCICMGNVEGGADGDENNDDYDGGGDDCVDHHDNGDGDDDYVDITDDYGNDDDDDGSWA